MSVSATDRPIRLGQGAGAADLRHGGEEGRDRGGAQGHRREEEHRTAERSAPSPPRSRPRIQGPGSAAASSRWSQQLPSSATQRGGRPANPGQSPLPARREV